MVEKQEKGLNSQEVKEGSVKSKDKVVTGDEEKENKIGGIFRRKGGSKLGKSSILTRNLPKMKCQLFDRSLNNSTYQKQKQHLQASPIRQFPFLQTLV